MKDEQKKNKGITLIALIITVVVLLILAGVTISTLTGDNGLLSKANEAKTETEKSAIREEIDLLLLQAKMGDKIEDIFKEGTVTKDGTVYEVSYKGNDFLLSDENEYIEKVEPAYEGEWTFNQSTQTLTAYNGDLTTKRGNQEIGEVIIPNYYNGKRVKKMGDFLFYNNENISNIKISEGIEDINNYCLSGCINIKGNLVIPNSVIKIERYAFNGCTSLDGELKLSKNLETIGESAFIYCSKLRGDLIIPDNVISVGGSAFKGCSSLDGKIKLGNKLERIGSNAFDGVNKITGDLIIPNSVVSIGQQAFLNCASLTGNLKLSQNLQTIGRISFYEL